MPSLISLFSTNPTPMVHSSCQTLNFIFMLAEFTFWQLLLSTFYLNPGGLTQI